MFDNFIFYLFLNTFLPLPFCILQGKYITYDPNIFPMLESFRKSGKATFLLTNSLWDYTQVVMNYLHSQKISSEKNLEWTDFFDLIITGGNKPAFIEDER